MNLKLKAIGGFGALALLALLVPSAARATSWTSSPTDVCPAPNGGNSGGEGVSGTYESDTTTSGGVVTGNTGCNVLITFNANGSITTTFPNGAPSYDSGGDDNLVGVINNTSTSLTAINLSSAAYDIFGFDGDGICGNAALTGPATSSAPGYTFVEGFPCNNITDTSFGTYGGPYVTYSNINSADTSGTVNFGNGGIASGGSDFFSLEGPVDVDLGVSAAGVPEPGTIVLLGLGCVALARFRRRRLA